MGMHQHFGVKVVLYYRRQRLSELRLHRTERGVHHLRHREISLGFHNQLVDLRIEAACGHWGEKVFRRGAWGVSFEGITEGSER